MATQNGRSLADLLAELLEEALRERERRRSNWLKFIIFLLFIFYTLHYCSLYGDLDYNKQGTPHQMDMQDKDEKQPKEDSVKVAFYKTD